MCTLLAENIEWSGIAKWNAIEITSGRYQLCTSYWPFWVPLRLRAATAGWVVMPVHRSLFGDLQQIHSGAPVRKISPTLRVLGPGQFKEHTGQLHFHWAQSSKFSGSEQCEFMSTLATQAGSFAVGHCLTLCVTRLAGWGSSVGLLSSDRERNHNAGERGGCCGCTLSASVGRRQSFGQCGQWTAGGMAEAMVYAHVVWVGGKRSDCLSVCVGITVCDWGKGFIHAFHLWPLRKIWHPECLGM